MVAAGRDRSEDPSGIAAMLALPDYVRAHFPGRTTVTLTLKANETVNVDTSNGTPTLTLNDGGIATYSGGSGSSALTFGYTVASGENTPDLIVSAVNLNGATAQDANGHDAILTGAVGNPAGTLQIDTTAPLQTGIEVSPSNGAATAGTTLSVTLDFNEPVAVSGGAPTLTLNDGGSAVYDAAATVALGNADKLVFEQLRVVHKDGGKSGEFTQA